MRYTQALQAIDNFKHHGIPITKIVGHSLGGSVALQLQKDMPGQFTTVTYGAPVASATPGLRYRRALDPISATDLGAIAVPSSQLNAHSYSGYSRR